MFSSCSPCHHAGLLASPRRHQPQSAPKTHQGALSWHGGLRRPRNPLLHAPHAPIHPTQPRKASSLCSLRLQPPLCFTRSAQPPRHEPPVPQGQGDQCSPPRSGEPRSCPKHLGDATSSKGQAEAQPLLPGSAGLGWGEEREFWSSWRARGWLCPLAAARMSSGSCREDSPHSLGRVQDLQGGCEELGGQGELPVRAAPREPPPVCPPGSWRLRQRSQLARGCFRSRLIRK